MHYSENHSISTAATLIDTSEDRAQQFLCKVDANNSGSADHQDPEINDQRD
jgi:hypothetical protein